MTWASRPSRAQSIGSETSKALSEVAWTPPRTNLEALRTFIASRRPTFIWRLVERRVHAGPGHRRPPAHARPRRTCPGSRRGRSALPLDLPIFLRSGSRMQPEIIACDHGTTPCSKCERTTRENSQVRMMSCACVHRSIGKTRCEQVVVGLPAARDVRGQRRRRPGVHDVGVADEAAGLAALVLGVAVRRRRSTGRSAARPRGAAAGGRSRAHRRRRGGTRPGTGCRRSAAGRSASRR